MFLAIGTRDSAHRRIVAEATNLPVLSWGFQEVDAALIDATPDEYVQRVQVGR